MSAKSQQIKKRLIKAMEDKLCVVTAACKQAGCDRSTYYDYYNKDPQFKEIIDNMSDIGLDFAEEIMYERIKEKSDTMIIFYLKTKGKKRGYIERTELAPVKPEKPEISVHGKKDKEVIQNLIKEFQAEV